MNPVHAPWADQNLVMVAMAALLCVCGAFATSRFFWRMTTVQGAGSRAWLALTSLASGVTIWCTHFVVMLGYHPGVPIQFDWALTGGSLAIAVTGSALAFAVAGRPVVSRAWIVTGGIVLGLSICAMHYVGMSAMGMGTMTWSGWLVALSVLFAVGGSVALVWVARSSHRHARNLMAGLFVITVVLLHFTGMSAMGVMHRMGAGMPMASGDDTVLAVAIVIVSLLTIGVGVVGYQIDTQGRLAAMEDLRTLALADGLTGLPNRSHLNTRLEAEIARAAQTGSRLGLGVVDVDDFKQINDSRGHLIGDEVLRVIATRMQDLTSSTDEIFVARMGGDEFMVLCRLEDDAALPRVLDELRQTVSRAIQIGADVLVPQVSIGAAVYPDDAGDAQALINNADLAMYRAKSDTHVGTAFYDRSVDERTRLRRGLVADLRQAITGGELFLHYQIQASVTTSTTRGFEALLRWQHPQLGLVSPAEFIPLAESSGAIVPIGEWVLRTACADAVQWDSQCRLSVNLSAVQLAEPGLVDMIRTVLGETGMPPERLELEVTETAVYADRAQALRTLLDIKALGVSIALDDFGVGYSSLDALRVFPFDRIKLDRSFFMGESRSQTVALVETVLSLGRIFGMSVIAEGIESPDQLALLRETGCEEVQGFLLGRPASLEALIASGEIVPIAVTATEAVAETSVSRILLNS